MKENKYDNSDFFEAYSEFPRSKFGLQEAGEWHKLKAMLPNFTNKQVLDLGCGFGWHCNYAVKNGASKVVGVDLSEKMLEVAQHKFPNEIITFKKSSIEDYECHSNTFDVVLSSLAFHYIRDFDSVCTKVYNSLKENGDFVFSVEHPCFTAREPQDWIYDTNKQPLYWPIDNYFYEGRRNMKFLGEPIIKYHRTLETYINTLIRCGFTITQISEPTPSVELLNKNIEMKQELRRPMMLIISAKK